jgi:inhibitor of cysteine peptidase
MKGENMTNTKWFIFSFLATILVISSIPLSLYLIKPQNKEQTDLDIALNRFSSYEELKNFLETSPNGVYYPLVLRGGQLENADTLAVPQSTTGSYNVESSDYSKTNIQVEGVDEADIVKTDGEYIYVVSGGNLTIVKAYPPEEARVVSKIVLDGGISGIFINGDKLAVFETDYTVYLLYGGVAVRESSSSSEEKIDNDSTTDVAPEDPKPVTYEPPTTSVKVYDISDKENPVLTRDFSIDGNYFSSRMIGDYVYVVATMYTFFTETDVALPRIQSDNETEVIPATEIYYCNLSDSSYTFTTIAALNIKNDAQEPTHETIVLGGTSNIYVSQNNIYLTFPDYQWQEGENMKTVIQRIKVDGQSITIEASGEVPGYILNQFSMDEHNSHFRVATTVHNYNWRTFAIEETSKNNVYVLDMNLDVVGKLEDLAPGEQIYSARFMGDRCYVVTFRNIDPLFVIDLSNPTAPTVLGQLKVTGYSGYLHPYDENHIIGIGKETDYDGTEDFSWYQGVKISLFDVSDVANPVEVAKYEIGDRGTDSPILYDHKALLFDKEKNLLVIPVTVAEINASDYPDGVPDWAYGRQVWQGAYVFNISLDGIEFRGGVTHLEDGALENSKYYYYGYYDYIVQRSLYIDDVLYTISSMKVKMNNLATLAEINAVDLS